MGEMFSSFDGMQLYLNKEVPEGARAVAVIVHGLCEHQGRYDYFAEKFHQAKIGTYRFDHRGMGAQKGNGHIIPILMNYWMTHMPWLTWRLRRILISRSF